MKKNISINISGIIFHIEEDGYENLKKYLDSINKYFSSFEDSSEILADIESRIAEIFLSKLNEEKQVITSDDVNALVTTMGSVSDFKAAEEEEDFSKKANPAQEEQTAAGETSSQSSGPQSSSSSGKTYTPPKSLMRDQKRKILGGVCSGIANYMNVDAVWIRLLFALLTFAYGITLVVYVIMWVVVPGSYDLAEPEVEKKLFRDRDRKVIGGVSGGVSAYLGLDIIAVRVLFVVFTLAGGIGFFVYIVMWAILPEARSLTDKMQMQGEPVTLSNIESSYKKSQDDRGQEETTATKILMFPFRVIGMILSALAKILVPLIEVLRVAIGILIVIFGMGLVFSTIVAGGIMLGLFSATTMSFPWAEHGEMNIPLEQMTRAFPGWIALAGFFASIAPSLFVVLLGVSVVARRIVFNAVVGWSLFAIFFVSVALLAVGIPKTVYNFKEYGEYKTEEVYPTSNKKAILRINEVGLDDYHGVDMVVKGYKGKEIKVVKNFSAQGSTRQKAIENAQMIDYNVNVQDSIWTFDSNVTFRPDAIFRDQRIDVTLNVPYNYPFTMDKGICRLVRQYIDWEDTENETWQVTEDRGLECISCQSRREENALTDLRDFDELEISGKFDVRIVRGHDYSVEITGSEKEKDRYDIERVGETLVIKFEDSDKFNFELKDFNIEEVRITITMPSLEKIEATGWGTIRFDQFDQDDMEIELQGPVNLKGEVNTQRLSITLNGRSEADLSGRAQRLNADIQFASKLKAYDLEVVDAFVETNAASSAKVSVSGTLEMEEGPASNIDYRGNPMNVVKRD